MKLHQLRSAAAIVENNLNLTRAAATLNATQPGVSAHIRALEREFGAPLFIRDGKRFSGMTPLGEALMPDIIAIVAQTEALEAKARALHAPQQHSIVIASGPTPAHILPTTLRTFLSRYPHTKVNVRSGGHDAILEDMAEGRADICLIGNLDGVPSNIELHSCYSLGWILLANEKSPLVDLAELTLEAINDHPIITYDDQYASSRTIAKAFEDAQLKSNISISTGDVDAMKRLVRNGLGVAILRSGNFELEDHGVVALSLDHLLPPSQIYVGVRKNMDTSPSLRHLIGLLKSPGDAQQILQGSPSLR